MVALYRNPDKHPKPFLKAPTSYERLQEREMHHAQTYATCSYSLGAMCLITSSALTFMPARCSLQRSGQVYIYQTHVSQSGHDLFVPVLPFDCAKSTAALTEHLLEISSDDMRAVVVSFEGRYQCEGLTSHEQRSVHLFRDDSRTQQDPVFSPRSLA